MTLIIPQDRQFQNELNQLAMDRVIISLYKKGYFDTDGLGGVANDALINECLEGAYTSLDGLDGFFSKVKRAVKKVNRKRKKITKKVSRKVLKPIHKIRRKIGIKTPPAIKKIEREVKRIGYQIDKNKGQILTAVAVVTAVVFAGPAALAALQSAGAATVGAFKAGVAKMVALGGQAKASALLAYDKVKNYMKNGKLPKATADQIEKTKNMVKSKDYIEEVKKLAKKELEKKTGVKFNSLDAKTILEASFNRYQNKLEKDLQRAESQTALVQQSPAMAQQNGLPYTPKKDTSLEPKDLIPLVAVGITLAAK